MTCSFVVRYVVYCFPILCQLVSFIAVLNRTSLFNPVNECVATLFSQRHKFHQHHLHVFFIRIYSHDFSVCSSSLSYRVFELQSLHVCNHRKDATKLHFHFSRVLFMCSVVFVCYPSKRLSPKYLMLYVF